MSALGHKRTKYRSANEEFKHDMVSPDTRADAMSILFCSCRINPVGPPSNWIKQESGCTGQHIPSRHGFKIDAANKIEYH